MQRAEHLKLLEDDTDVFGDGSATLVSAPGHKAKLFINHDKAQSDTLKLLPAFYD
jgi:hypothetical protein